MIRNFNHAMSSGISIGTGAESDVWRGEGREGLPAGHLGELLQPCCACSVPSERLIFLITG